VGVGTIGSLVVGHSSRDSPNNFGRPDSNATAPTTAETENPSASPTAWTADGKRAFASRSELWTAVNGYLAWQAGGGVVAHMSQDVLRYGLPIGSWVVSRVADFACVFDPDREQTLAWNRKPSRFTSFDDDLSGWNLSNAVTMKGMFAAASTFTGKGLEMWDVSKVIDFAYMFSYVYNFVGNVSAWSTSSATRMDGMFFSKIQLCSFVSMCRIGMGYEWSATLVSAALYPLLAPIGPSLHYDRYVLFPFALCLRV
jgi:Mycoplasma protein of unknown function, DUF285